MKIKISDNFILQSLTNWLPLLCGLLVVTLLLNACQDQLEDTAKQPEGQKTAVSITLFDNLNTEADQTLKEATLVLFDKDGTYANVPLISDIEIKDGKLSVPLNPGQYQIVLLANCLNQLAITQPTVGQSKEDYLKGLILQLTEQGNKIDATHIPMWGELATTIDNGHKDLTFEMMRMTSRVDLSVGATNLTLTGILLYHTSSNGQLAPFPGNITNGNASDEETGELPVVNKPSLPDNQTFFENPVAYEGSDIVDNGCEGKIYPLETAAASKSEEGLTKAPCMVIEATYTDDKGTQHPKRYYRVDFFSIDKTTKDSTFLDLLRNHQYKINIAQVNDNGFDTAEKALSSRYGSIDYSVIDWSDPDIHDIVFDGNVLGVNHRVFTAYGDGSLEKGYKDGDHLLVYTDYGKGWNVKDIIDDKTKTKADWITLTPTKGKSNEKTTCELTVKALDQGADARSATITLSGSDHLMMPITVKQVKEYKYSLTMELLTPNGKETKAVKLDNNAVIDFPWDDLSKAQQIKISWTPANMNCTVKPLKVMTQDDFKFKATGTDGCTDLNTIGELTADQNGKPIKLQAAGKVENPMSQLASQITFSIGDKIISKVLSFRQRHDGGSFTGPQIALCGDGYIMNVQSNTDWVITSDDTGSNYIDWPNGSKQQKGMANIVGTDAGVNIKDDQAIDYKPLTLFLKSADGKTIYDQLQTTVRYIKYQPNTYIVAPGGSISFSGWNPSIFWQLHENGQNSGTTATGKLDAKVVWQDHDKLIKSVTLKEGTKGMEDAMITVETSDQATPIPNDHAGTWIYPEKKYGINYSKGGNAAIALTEDGKIRWLWDIWVTDYNPDDPANQVDYYGVTFMDRNVGALNNVKDNIGDNGKPLQDINSLGVYYQGQSLNPLPAPGYVLINYSGKTLWAGTDNANTIRSIHDISSNPIEFSMTNYGVNGTYTIRQAIENPTALSANLDNSNQDIRSRHVYWTSEGTKGLWVMKSGKRGPFNPCPKGWRIMSLSNISRFVETDITHNTPSDDIVKNYIHSGKYEDQLMYPPTIDEDKKLYLPSSGEWNGCGWYGTPGFRMDDAWKYVAGTGLYIYYYLEDQSYDPHNEMMVWNYQIFCRLLHVGVYRTTVHAEAMDDNVGATPIRCVKDDKDK